MAQSSENKDFKLIALGYNYVFVILIEVGIAVQIHNYVKVNTNDTVLYFIVSSSQYYDYKASVLRV